MTIEKKGEQRPLTRSEEVIARTVNPDMRELEGLDEARRPSPISGLPLMIECADGIIRELVLSDPPELGYDLIE